MKLKLLYTPVAICTLVLSLGLPAFSTVAGATTSSTVSSEAAARQVIEQMNRYVSERKLPELLRLFAEDSVKMDLYPKLSYGEETTKDSNKVKTTSLKHRWQAVAPILFSTTIVYQRSIKNMEIHIDKGLAVAWLDIETESLSTKPGATSKFNRFKEICILRHYGSGWKIVALSNNRHDISTKEASK